MLDLKLNGLCNSKMYKHTKYSHPLTCFLHLEIILIYHTTNKISIERTVSKSVELREENYCIEIWKRTR